MNAPTQSTMVSIETGYPVYGSMGKQPTFSEVRSKGTLTSSRTNENHSYVLLFKNFQDRQFETMNTLDVDMLCKAFLDADPETQDFEALLDLYKHYNKKKICAQQEQQHFIYKCAVECHTFYNFQDENSTNSLKYPEIKKHLQEIIDLGWAMNCGRNALITAAIIFVILTIILAVFLGVVANS